MALLSACCCCCCCSGACCVRDLCAGELATVIASAPRVALTGRTAQRFVCLLRFDATPKRRPQILQTNATDAARISSESKSNNAVIVDGCIGWD